MPQYTFDDGFYHASKARDIAVGAGSPGAGGNTKVLEEINVLQLAVDAAARIGEMSVMVGYPTGVSPMTTQDDYTGAGSDSHYDAWADLHAAEKANPAFVGTLRRAAIEMDRVIGYFTRLGYSIERVRGGTSPPTVGTENRIQWYIKW